MAEAAPRSRNAAAIAIGAGVVLLLMIAGFLLLRATAGRLRAPLPHPPLPSAPAIPSAPPLPERPHLPSAPMPAPR